MHSSSEIEIQEYWENRAKSNQSVQATTNDIYLRELEISTFGNVINEFNFADGAKILDLGCGDGYTTLNIANNLNSNYTFLGLDYSEEMIQNANNNLKKFTNLKNDIKFDIADATKIKSIIDEKFNGQKFDIIITDRCLINIPSVEKQYDTIKQISECLNENGVYIAIENFVETNNNFNDLRKKFNLEEIPVRWHNFFFEENEFLSQTKKYFNAVEFRDFSSSYYLATRIIYSAICQIEKKEPDYNHEINKLALNLPCMGNFSPIRLIILKKGK